MQTGVYRGISHLSSDGTTLWGMGQFLIFDRRFIQMAKVDLRRPKLLMNRK